MSGSKYTTSSLSSHGRRWTLRLAVIAIAAGYVYWQRLQESGYDIGSDSPSPPEAGAAKPESTLRTAGGYEIWENCTLVDHRNNDGDSFHVNHAGEIREVRLYFVDAPEKYWSDRHEDQHQRIRDQAADFGGLTVEETVSLGQEARDFTMGQLTNAPFAVYTRNEAVFGSKRIYGFVRIRSTEKWLSESLIEQGLARIHTKGAPLPTGESTRQFEGRLRSLEKAAKKQRQGAWRSHQAQ